LTNYSVEYILLSISLGLRTLSGIKPLRVLSPENIGQLSFNAKATYCISFKCSDTSFLDSGIYLENSDSETRVICSITIFNVVSNISLDKSDTVNILSLCFSNSTNKNSGQRNQIY